MILSLLVLAPIAAHAVTCTNYQSCHYGCTYCWRDAWCPAGYTYHSYQRCGTWKLYCHSKCVRKFDWPCADCGKICPTVAPTLAPYTPPVSEPDQGFIGNELEAPKERACTKKYTKRWPHCDNVQCLKGTFDQLKSKCLSNDKCDGFSFSTGTSKGWGCLKKQCTGKEESRKGYGSGSHDYWDCTDHTEVGVYLVNEDNGKVLEFVKSGARPVLSLAAAEADQKKHERQLWLWRDGYISPKVSPRDRMYIYDMEAAYLKLGTHAQAKFDYDPELRRIFRKDNPSHFMCGTSICKGTAGIEYKQLMTNAWCGENFHGERDLKHEIVSLDACTHACNADSKCNFIAFIEGQRCVKFEKNSCHNDYHRLPYAVYAKMPATSKWRVKNVGEVFPETRSGHEYFYIANVQTHQVVTSPKYAGYGPVFTWQPEGGDRQLWRWDDKGRLINKAGEALEMADHKIVRYKVPSNIKIGQMMSMKFEDGSPHHEPFNEHYAIYRGKWVWFANAGIPMNPPSKKVATTDAKLKDGYNQQWFWAAGTILSGVKNAQRIFDIPEKTSDGLRGDMGLEMGMHGWISSSHPWHWSQKFYLVPEKLTREYVDMISTLKDTKKVNPIEKAYIYNTIARKHISSVIGMSPENLVARSSAIGDILRKTADELKKTGKDAAIASIVGNSLGIVGAFFTLLGIGLSGITWGASLGLTVVGTVIGVAPATVASVYDNAHDLSEQRLKSQVDALARTVMSGGSALGTFLDQYKEVMEELSQHSETESGKNELFGILDNTKMADLWKDAVLRGGLAGWNMYQYISTNQVNFQTVRKLAGMRKMMHSMGVASQGAQLADDVALSTGKMALNTIRQAFPDFMTIPGRALAFTQVFQGGVIAVGAAFSIYGLVNGIQDLDRNQMYSQSLYDSADYLQTGVPDMYRALMKFTGDYATMKIFDEQAAFLRTELEKLNKDLPQKSYNFEDDTWRELKRSYKGGKYTIDSRVHGNLRNWLDYDSVFRNELPRSGRRLMESSGVDAATIAEAEEALNQAEEDVNTESYAPNLGFLPATDDDVLTDGDFVDSTSAFTIAPEVVSSDDDSMPEGIIELGQPTGEPIEVDVDEPIEDDNTEEDFELNYGALPDGVAELEGVNLPDGDDYVPIEEGYILEDSKEFVDVITPDGHHSAWQESYVAPDGYVATLG